MKRLIGIFLVILVNYPVKAEFYTGNDLYKICGGTVETTPICSAYITGVTDAFIFASTKNVPNSPCLPYDTVTIAQIRDIVVKYLSENPDQRHYTASSNILVALKRAFPCR